MVDRRPMGGSKRVFLMSKDNILLEKSFDFSVHIVEAFRQLSASGCDMTLARQLLRSGTSIGANAQEANYAVSRSDFIAKLHISLKEAAETAYWLRLLHRTGYLSAQQAKPLLAECENLIFLLTSILKKSKSSSSSPET